MWTFSDHLLRVLRRRGRWVPSWAVILSHSSELAVEMVAENGRFLGFEGADVGFGEIPERRVLRLFQRVRAAVSAAWIASLLMLARESPSWPDIELVATRDFCRRIRVLSKASNVDLCCLTAVPFSASAFVAWDIVATTDFCSSAIILRSAARSSGRTWSMSDSPSMLSSSLPVEVGESFSSCS